ncbi:MAG: ApaLI family restriction endonuclease [Anaerolineae bacterium]|nr:ApaLI family restriction endonuclease [Anaerolineae bacterium]
MAIDIEHQIRELAASYAANLKQKIEDRVEEMQEDDFSHFLVYRVLGVSTKEGHLIDIYQNKGRFLYNAAGRFLEEATKLCFLAKYPESGSVRIPNTRGRRPKTFEIDCLVGTDAIEIKWRDATTDGDHITKEHTRISTIADAGYIPIRVMFFYPNRSQAIKIQQTLATLYSGVNGQYYFGDSAWDYVEKRTEISLKSILEKLADENAEELT